MTVYEKNLLDLFDKLNKEMLNYSITLSKMLDIQDEIIFNEKQILQENLSDCGKVLNETVKRIVKYLDMLDKSFDIKKPLEDVMAFSKRVKRLVSESQNARQLFNDAEESGLVTAEDIKKNEILVDNLTKLSNKIIKYNNRFENKILTLKKAFNSLQEETIIWFKKINIW